MAQSWNNWCWQLGLASFLAISGAIANLGDCAKAQSNIVPDETLGSLFDSVNQVIYGGTIRGALKSSMLL